MSDTAAIKWLKRHGASRASIALGLMLFSAVPAHATGINDLVGTWDMLHDGWKGTLVINPSDQHLNGIEVYWVDSIGRRNTMTRYCDEQRKAPFGSIWSGTTAVAWSTAGGRAR